MKKILLLTIGWLSIFLGMIGIFLPILPTTPFLLLAAWCFYRSSERFYQWLLNHPYFGEYISNFINKGGISKRHKITAISSIWIGVLISVLLLILKWQKPFIAIGIILICSAVTVYLLRMKTVDD